MIYVLIVLHSLNGHEILVNPKMITNMRSGVPGEKNKNLAEAANCVINMTDGKFVTVIETCDKVQELIKEQK